MSLSPDFQPTLPPAILSSFALRAAVALSRGSFEEAERELTGPVGRRCRRPGADGFR
jgi:hypothetical protein